MAETAADIETMIAAVNAAIIARLSGGAVDYYSVGGRNLRYCTLKELTDLKQSLYEMRSALRGGARNYARFERPV